MILYKRKSNMDTNSPFQKETTSPYILATVIEKWSEHETLALIQAYKLYKYYFELAKKKKFVWEHISQHLEKEGIHKSRIHVETKWKSLLRTYRKYSSKDLNSSSSKRFKYMDELIDVVGEEEEVKEHVATVSESDSDVSADECEQNSIDNIFGLKKNSDEEGPEVKRQKVNSSPYDNLLRLRKNYLKCKIEEIASKRTHREEYLSLLTKERELKRLRDVKWMQLKEREVVIEEKKLKLLESFLGSQGSIPTYNLN